MHKGEAQQAQQAQQQDGQETGDAALQKQPLPHKQAHLHARARSCSPADTGGLGMEAPLSGARSMGSLNSGGSASQRGRSSLAGSQSLRPPRPPAQQQGEAAGVAGGTPDSHQASAEGAPARRPADSTESGLLPDGWEAVDAADASDPSLAPTRREFSMAHLLAPQADGAAVAGVTPRATSSSSVEAPAAFVGQARAKVRFQSAALGWTLLYQWSSMRVECAGSSGPAVRDVASDASCALTNTCAGGGGGPQHLNQQGLCGVQGKQEGVGTSFHFMASLFTAGLLRLPLLPVPPLPPCDDTILLQPHPSSLFHTPQIRVADNAGEWTVSRRYRNFEVLHRQLRAYTAYRLKLPPKRIFIHSNK